MSKVLETGFVLLFLTFGLGGLFWLLFRRCQLTVPQLLAATFFYGLMLALLHAWLSVLGEVNQRFVGLATSMVLTVALGTFFGARTASRVPPGQPFFRWTVFLSALAMPATIVPGLITTVMMFSGRSPVRTHPFGVFIWLLLILPTVTGIATQVMVTQSTSHGGVDELNSH